MAAVFLAPFYIAANIYAMILSLRWLKGFGGIFRNKSFQVVFMILFLFLMASPVIAFFAPASMAQRVLKSIGNFWMGAFLYLMLFLAFSLLAGLILRLAHVCTPDSLKTGTAFRVLGLIVLVLTVGFTSYSLIHARTIKTANYSVSVAKAGGNLRELNIALIADLHLGYNADCSLMRQMVDKVNAQNPDIVLVAGDIFDNEYEALDNPQELEKILSGLKSRYGTYTVMGNHDIEEPILGGFTFASDKAKVTDPRFIEFVKNSGMKLLSDESVLIDDSFYVVGRLDREEPGNETKSRKTPSELLQGLDTSKTLIDLEHEPANLEECADAGFDLDLCGHTHAGQVFPGTLVIKFFWENPWGYKQVGSMQNIVTSGVGSFGPYMRNFCDSEICMVHVTFGS